MKVMKSAIQLTALRGGKETPSCNPFRFQTFLFPIKQWARWALIEEQEVLIFLPG